jgi:hypothetical protein
MKMVCRVYVQENISMDLPLLISERPKPAVHRGHLTIGGLIFPRMDQIDFTGPFEVLSRISDSTVHVMPRRRLPYGMFRG